MTIKFTVILSDLPVLSSQKQSYTTDYKGQSDFDKFSSGRNLISTLFLGNKVHFDFHSDAVTVKIT